METFNGLTSAKQTRTSARVSISTFTRPDRTIAADLNLQVRRGAAVLVGGCAVPAGARPDFAAHVGIERWHRGRIHVLCLEGEVSMACMNSQGLLLAAVLCQIRPQPATDTSNLKEMV